MTVRPALERSSATTLWIRAHCSPCAPGGVSQRICQSPCTDRTAPCALAEAVRPRRNAMARQAAARRVAARHVADRPAPGKRLKPAAMGWPRLAARLMARLIRCFEGPIRVDSLDFLKQ